MDRIFFPLVLVIASLLLHACEAESNYRFKDEATNENGTTPETGGYPDDGSLAFHENFQSWKREGYINQQLRDCEADQMTTAIIMYQPDVPVTKTYDGFQVKYSMKDYAVNPVCGNKVGTSSDDSEISTGYIALQGLIFYECGGHDSEAELVLSELPSVSKIAFSISYGGNVEYVGGVTLWKKTRGQSSFTRIGDYQPADPLEGELFTVTLNEKNVQLKFTPALSDRGTGVNDGVLSNRSVRIHDLHVWSMEE